MNYEKISLVHRSNLKHSPGGQTPPHHRRCLGRDRLLRSVIDWKCSNMREAQDSHDSFAAVLSAAAPRAEPKSDSMQILRISDASTFTSRASRKSKPFSPSTTISLAPAALLAMTGRPHAIGSK